MSSACDLLPVTELAWKLYRACYTVSPVAPPVLQLLLPELSALAQSNYLLHREAQDVTSTLLCSGEDWIAKVKGLLARVEATLRELELETQRYESGGYTARTKWGQMVDWVKVVVGGRDMEMLREKLVYHNGILSLLLYSCGNTSLQKIKVQNETQGSLISEIEELVRRSTGHTSTAVPGAAGPALINPLCAQLMRNASDGQWSSVGVSEWIHVCTFWLTKSQIPPAQSVSTESYVSLFKVSWILTDIVQRHPQRIILERGARHDAEVLAEGIKREFEKTDTTGILLEDMERCDLSIWAMEVKGE